MFAEVRRRLAQAAGPSGLLLVLDDLQWADQASAVLLADVARQLRGTRTLALATYREPAASGNTSAGPPPRLSAEADTERVDLRGLPAGAVGERPLAAGLPRRRTRPVRCTPKRGAIRPCSELAARSPSSGAAGRRRCRDGWRRRRPSGAQLPDPARALVQTAAVAGNDFSVGVVARILDVPVLALLGPLDECRAAGFLVAGDRPGDRRSRTRWSARRWPPG